MILGGARSGKSTYAVELAKKLCVKGRSASGEKKPVVFIATARAGDREMEKRIALHQAQRPKDWGLIEEPEDVDVALSGLGGKYELVLIDCLGLLISNFLMKKLNEKQINAKIEKIIKSIKETHLKVILISNEVGSGIVPENLLAREFRDLLGLSNQMFAQSAEQVIMMHSGIPLKIKSLPHRQAGRVICRK